MTSYDCFKSYPDWISLNMWVTKLKGWLKNVKNVKRALADAFRWRPATRSSCFKDAFRRSQSRALFASGIRSRGIQSPDLPSKTRPGEISHAVFLLQRRVQMESGHQVFLLQGGIQMESGHQVFLLQGGIQMESGHQVFWLQELVQAESVTTYLWLRDASNRGPATNHPPLPDSRLISPTSTCFWHKLHYV